MCSVAVSFPPKRLVCHIESNHGWIYSSPVEYILHFYTALCCIIVHSVPRGFIIIGTAQICFYLLSEVTYSHVYIYIYFEACPCQPHIGVFVSHLEQNWDFAKWIYFILATWWMNQNLKTLSIPGGKLHLLHWLSENRGVVNRKGERNDTSWGINTRYEAIMEMCKIAE